MSFYKTPTGQIYIGTKMADEDVLLTQEEQEQVAKANNLSTLDELMLKEFIGEKADCEQRVKVKR